MPPEHPVEILATFEVNRFSQVLGLPTAGGDGVHALADAAVAMVSAGDVAEVAARLLVADDVARCPNLLEVTGREPATVAGAVSEAAGGVVARAEPPDALRPFLDVLATDCAAVSPDGERATGLKPRKAASFLRRELRRRALDSGSDDGGAYNNRSTWTANYRGVLPFDEVRRKTRGMGLRSKSDYRDVGIPKYCPSRPFDMYPDQRAARVGSPEPRSAASAADDLDDPRL